jgi:hypothetical protein
MWPKKMDFNKSHTHKYKGTLWQVLGRVYIILWSSIKRENESSHGNLHVDLYLKRLEIRKEKRVGSVE